MKEKDLTKKVLEEVANELSKVMNFEMPIETGRKTTIKQLKDDLKEAAGELNEDDEISDESQKALIILGINLPSKFLEEEKEEEETTPGNKAKGRKIGVANPEVSKRNKLIESLIAKGKFTQVEIIEKVLEKFPDHSKSGITTMISDGKNPKYNKFDKLVKIGENKVLSF